MSFGVLRDGEGASGGGLGGIPEDEPEAWGGGAGEVAGGDLQVATVDVAVVKGYGTVGGYLFRSAAALGVVGAVYYGGTVVTGEGGGAVFGVVGDAPDAGGGLH